MQEAGVHTIHSVAYKGHQIKVTIRFSARSNDWRAEVEVASPDGVCRTLPGQFFGSSSQAAIASGVESAQQEIDTADE